MKEKNLVKQAKILLAMAQSGKVTITRGVDGVTVKVEAHHANTTLKQLDGSHSVGVREEPNPLVMPSH
tara:strand:+ start:41 stop:244 length:204 start_codon:yes stop_codon:yes gene_type:complete